VISVPLASANVRRVMTAQLIQKAQHGASSVPLLFDGIRRVTEVDWHDWTFWLGAGWLVTSVLVIGAFVLAVRAIRRATPEQTLEDDTHGHHGPDWLDIFLAAMLMVEVLVHHEETGRWRRPTFVLALTTLGFGIFHDRLRARMMKRRSLKISDDGVVVPGRFRFFGGFRASWGELDRIDVTPAAAAIVTRRGRTKRIEFATLLHGDEVRNALTVAQARLAEYKHSTDAAPESRASRDQGGRQHAEAD